MRVISGTVRGSVLSCPETDGLRPTTDRVKENIFNLIQYEILNKRVLDLFAGSGAMGIEALSRGAKYCVFSDNSSESVSAVKANVKKTRMEDKCGIYKDDFESVISRETDKFDLVFLDPPYHKGYVSKAIEKLISRKLLSENALIVAETDGDEEPGEFKELEIRTVRKYGRVKITVYQTKKGCD